jgi:hypothetical protein
MVCSIIFAKRPIILAKRMIIFAERTIIVAKRTRSAFRVDYLLIYALAISTAYRHGLMHG